MNKQKYGYLEGALSAIINVVLFALKLWVGLVSGSVAMIADAWHTLSDTLTSGMVLIGFWIAGKPRDKEHPFGHGRFEVIIALIIGVLLGLVGITFFKESYHQLTNAKHVQYTSAGIMVFVFSVLIKEGLAQFSLYLGKKIKSGTLIADGWHHRSDAIASALIVVGLFLGKYFWWFDSVLGFIVSLLIFYAAFAIIKEAVKTLMGEEADTDLKENILVITESHTQDVKGIHHIHVHRYGDHAEVTMHLQMPGHYSLQQAHDIVSEIEDSLRKKLNIEPTIHFEPYNK